MLADKLRKSVLQSAIQGKLTEQLATDDKVEDLLQAIKEEKELLIKEKKIKKQKPLPKITEDEIPFAIPENWKWVRLGEVMIERGQKKPDENFSYIDIGSIDNKKNKLGECKILSPEKAPSRARKLVNIGDIIYSTVRPYLLNTCIIDRIINPKPIVSTGFAVITTNNIDINKYIFKVLLSPMFNDYANDRENAKGVAYPAINDTKLKMAIIPLPPLAEQKRIVEKLDNVLANIDELKANEEKLSILQKNFPDRLKKSILQSAIQGKLTEQLATDDNVEDLLQAIKEEKERLIKEKKIKKQKPLPEITEDERPFEIPENWKWVRLDDICVYLQRGKSPIYSDIKKYPVVSQKCNQWSGFTLEPAKYLAPEVLEKYSDERYLKKHDILINSTGLGTVGRVCLFKTDSKYPIVVADSHVTVVRSTRLISEIYIKYFLSSPHIQDNIEDMCSGSTKQKELALNTIKNLLVALPPLAEQKRIVEKLDKLLADIEELKI